MFRVFIPLGILYFALLSHLYAQDAQDAHDIVIPASYGGRLNITMGRISGVRSGGIKISGNLWLSTYHKLDDHYYITGNIGASFEQSKYQNILFIDNMNIGFHGPHAQFILGRSLNAAGALHHDISDFGAPGGENDNTPISFFFDGNYTTNVAQQLTQPFASRMSLYYEPISKYVGLGLSYAPHIEADHPANYQFFARHTAQNEYSIAANTEFEIAQMFIGMTYGYTQADRLYNNQRPDGKITAKQVSFRAKERLKQAYHYNLYELNYGCLEDKSLKDCRIGMQVSDIQDEYTKSFGTYYHYERAPFWSVFSTDYNIGWSWHMRPSVHLGFETIIRHQENQKFLKSDFHWLAGIGYQF